MLIYITHRIIFSGFHWIKVITWYRAISDLVSVVWFCFDGLKAKLRASVPAQLLIGHGKQTKPFRRSPWRRNEKSWLTIPHRQTRRNPQFMQVLCTCVCLYYFIIVDDTKVCRTNTLISTTPQSKADANEP